MKTNKNIKKTMGLFVAIIMFAAILPFASVPSYAKSITVKPQGKVSAKLYGYNDIYVSWKKQTVRGATVRYKVEYKESAWNEYYILVAQTKKNNCRQADFEDGKSYKFKVTPYVVEDGVVYSGKAGYSSYIYTLKKINTPRVSKASKKYARVEWDNIPGESGYQIARSKYKTKKFSIVKRVNYKYSSAKVNTNTNIPYYYKVRAYKNVNGKRIYAPWSSVSLFPAHGNIQLKEYGVFLGINEDESGKLEQYKLVVIEPSEFSVQRIQQLQADGKKVYGYLNIGSLEEYRPYYDRFKHLSLGVYKDWPDERWIDVSASEWQSFLIDELSKQYADMGLDGFFLDNADIYYISETEDIYRGLCTILTGLKKYNIPLIINGGDAFVSKSIEEGTARTLFDGVNQETVFTKINFDNHTYGAQDEEETEYFKDYLAEVKDSGLTVYLLEYGASQALAQKIDDYCNVNGFIWYNAKSLELD